MAKVPTVKVVADNEDGFVVINESDFNSDEHELFDGEAANEEMTVDEIKAAVEDMDDVAELEAMLDAERKGKDRSGAAKAIEARIDALNAEE